MSDDLIADTHVMWSDVLKSPVGPMWINLYGPASGAPMAKLSANAGNAREETDFRKTLDIVTWDNRGLLRVAPLFHWTEQDVQAYMDKYQLPTCKHYFDPTKVSDNAECGLHTAA